MRKRYTEKMTDEFMTPIIVNKDGRLRDNDTLICFNYRSDRMREIAETLGVKRNFESAVKLPDNLNITCCTQYKKDFPFPLLFGPVSNKNVLAEWLAEHKVKQYHCAGKHCRQVYGGKIRKYFEICTL
jgi:2,3-bisphosphoglycerate-independent phosphoglycerate mutase